MFCPPSGFPSIRLLSWRSTLGFTESPADTPAFYAVGIMEGSHNTGMWYYVAANAFLKLYVVVLYMAQNFSGLDGVM